MRRIAAVIAALAPLAVGAAETVALDPVEIRLVLRHGPWPQPVLRDPSNRVSGDVGIPFVIAPGRVDAGRHEGIKRLRSDPLNLLGKYSDDASGASATKTRHVEPTHASFGQFKTPSLRNVALTAPYMHNGRLATLRDVVRHYSELDPDRVHADGEALLRPLNLSPRESDDPVAFLESLTDPRAAEPPGRPGRVGDCPD
jgi:cytochrome c peroxidase